MLQLVQYVKIYKETTIDINGEKFWMDSNFTLNSDATGHNLKMKFLEWHFEKLSLRLRFLRLYAQSRWSTEPTQVLYF